MIPPPSGDRVWLATGHTDMRRGFPELASIETMLELWASSLRDVKGPDKQDAPAILDYGKPERRNQMAFVGA